jgi:hypothetical protein
MGNNIINKVILICGFNMNLNDVFNDGMGLVLFSINNLHLYLFFIFLYKTDHF